MVHVVHADLQLLDVKQHTAQRVCAHLHSCIYIKSHTLCIHTHTTRTHRARTPQPLTSTAASPAMSAYGCCTTCCPLATSHQAPGGRAPYMEGSGSESTSMLRICTAGSRDTADDLHQPTSTFTYLHLPACFMFWRSRELLTHRAPSHRDFSHSSAPHHVTCHSLVKVQQSCSQMQQIYLHVTVL